MSHTSTEKIGGESTTLSSSDRHRLLVSERRQQLVQILNGTDTATDVTTLAEIIAERVTELDAGSREAIDRVKIELHHVHLPKMAEMGTLAYDPQSQRVRPYQSALDSIDDGGDA
ncbi:DUF7344 domain-containing protein [Halovivax gelatinilyticus]|uniref:DUF7344 domain-containing protein n=1 Tax=Halovivax gelatinilyticus TaxID=2961597 RepID=UPI0020CA7133|nr:hypothetical protein [Halovivax gelatinilyticus]